MLILITMILFDFMFCHCNLFLTQGVLIQDHSGLDSKKWGLKFYSNKYNFIPLFCKLLVYNLAKDHHAAILELITLVEFLFILISMIALYLMGIYLELGQWIRANSILNSIAALIKYPRDTRGACVSK